MENSTIPSTPVLIEDLGMMYPTETSKERKRFGMYQCQCGNIFKARTPHVKNGNTKSCGCHRDQRIVQSTTTHGMSKHRLHSVWTDMKRRCNNPSRKDYKNYGGRGITYCKEWEHFENFIKDMLPTYIEGLTLDREDHLGNYSKDNCRWTTYHIQARNTRKLRSNNTSGYRGVSWHKNSLNWSSCICVNYVNINLGQYDTALDAAIAYDTYILKHNLEHTPNNVLL